MYSSCNQIEPTTKPGRDLPLLQPFELEHHSLLQDFLDRFSVQSCEYNFVNLFCWQQVYNFSWFIHKKRFFIYDGVSNCLFMPLGKPFLPEQLFIMSNHLMDQGLSPNICLTSKSYIDSHPGISQFYLVQEDRDAAEYIYATQSLVQLQGSKLHKKRNLISQFKRRYPDYRIQPVGEKELPLIKGFAQDLLSVREPVTKELKEEFSAVEKAVQHWEKLGLEGLVLTVDDNIAAFCVFSRLNQDTYNIHFEKSNIAFKGSAQVINQETARFLWEKCQYLNREQDLGIPGLRQAKLSYDPHSLLIPYTLKFKTILDSGM